MKSSKSFFAFAALFITLQQSAIHAFAQPSTPRDSTWITNGNVTAVAYAKGLTYIGGDFTFVGPNTAYGAALNSTPSAPALKFPKVNGPIDVVTADGADGWYIGGRFTKVGDFTRNRIAHIKADGTVDPNWDPNPAGVLFANNSFPINAIIVNDSTIYVGGNFTSIGGQQRNGIAALNAPTGQATSWNPSVDRAVRTMLINGATMYVGGDFWQIGGQSRKFLAAIDLATGNATSWNPALNARVLAIAVSDTLVFAGGEFTSAGGQVRNHLAAFGMTSGRVTIWNPNITGGVYVLASKGSTLYVGGDFEKIGGLPKLYIAALSIYSNTPLNWNPVANGAVRSIDLNGSTFYVGGDFTQIGGETRYRIAALDETTGKATAWISHASGPVRGLATNSNGSVVYVGGEFRSIGGQPRNRLAALNASNGSVTAWNPNALINGGNGSIYVMTVSGSNVYIGGSFTVVGGPRGRIAAINAATGAVTAWNPNANNNVHAITIDNSTVYVGGKFTTIGGQTRNLLAALDINTGLATSWNPNIGVVGVYAILANGATIYAGGDFYSVGAQPREALAAIDANTGQATTWNPNLNVSSIVYAMALDGSTLYIGGNFNTVNGQARNRLAAVDITTAVPTDWNPNANGTVQVLTHSGPNVYTAGAFTSIGIQTRNYLAAIDKATGAPADWNPNPNTFGSGQGLIAVGSAILAGGAFTTMGGNTQDYFAQFGNIVTSNNPPNAPSAVNQYKSDAATAISEGGTSDEKKVVFKATVSDPDNDQVKLQIELRKTAEAFTGSPTRESLLVNSGTPVSVAKDTLAAAGYKWRYRVMDALGSATDWVEFGTPGNTDFVIAGAPALTAVNQYKSDATTAIAEGGTTNEKKVIFKAMLSDPNGDQAKLQIELRKTAEAFTGTPNLQSSLINSGGQAIISRDTLSDANYKWRYRALDANGLASAWVDFGASANTDFIVATNKPPAAPTTLKQLRADEITAISEGGTTNESKVVFKGTVSDPDGEQVKLQIELRKMAEAFTGTPNLQSSLVNSGAPAIIAAENLSSANYKWRYRAMDARGLANAWAEFGTSGNTDFIVNTDTEIPIYPGVPSPQISSTEFWVDILVGNQAKPVSNLFGVSFVLNFSPTDYIDVVVPYSSSVASGNFIGNDVVVYQTVNESAGTVSVGISRKAGQGGVSGYGRVARVKFIARDNIPNNTQALFSVTEAKANDHQNNPINLGLRSKLITINNNIIDDNTVFVWPGDTNNDGVVDQSDVLPIGFYWGSKGPARLNASLDWMSRPSAAWTPLAATHANANGDSIVNQGEISAIGFNWGKSHPMPSFSVNRGLEKSQTLASATIMPEIIPALQPPNQEFFMRIKVAEVSNLFGLSFELTYDRPQFLQALAVEPDSLFGNDVVFYSNIDAANGKIAVGISRKAGQVGANGAGAVVRVKAKIATNATAGEKINLSLQNVVANDANGAAMSLSPQAASLTIISTTGIDANEETLRPASYRLYQNHPNPFNAGTLIKYEIPQAGPVSLKIYNLAGQEILEMVNAVQQAGRYQINWNGRDNAGTVVPSGVYVYKLRVNGFEETRKMTFMK